MNYNLRGRLHTAEFDFKRGIYQIREVDLHEMPAFWMRRVCRATRGWGSGDAYTGMQKIERDSPVRIFDHWGMSTTEDGHRCFVTEPYQKFDDPQLIHCVHLIGMKLGLDWKVFPSSCSWWFPDNTIRIEFFECRHAEPCDWSLTESEHRHACKLARAGRRAG